MRVVKETMIADFRVSIFNWNEKYLVKFEAGPFEQTYKIREFDVLDENELVNKVSSEQFISQIEQRFNEMAKDWFELNKE